MVENLAEVAPVEVKVGVAEVHEGEAANEEQQPGVVSLARGLKRVVADLVSVRQVVNVVFFLPGVTASVAREVMIVAAKQDINNEVTNLRRRRASLLHC